MELSSPTEASSPKDDVQIAAGEAPDAPHTGTATLPAIGCGVPDAIMIEGAPAGALEAGIDPEVTFQVLQEGDAVAAHTSTAPAPQVNELVQNTTACAESVPDANADADVITAGTSKVEVHTATEAEAGDDEMSLSTDRLHAEAALMVGETAAPPPKPLVDASNELPEPSLPATAGFESLSAACAGKTDQPGGVAANAQVDAAICATAVHCAAPQTVDNAGTDPTVDVDGGRVDAAVVTQACAAASGEPDSTATSLPGLEQSSATMECLSMPASMELASPTLPMAAVSALKTAQVTADPTSWATHNEALAADIIRCMEEAATATAEGREEALYAPSRVAEPATDAAAEHATCEEAAVSRVDISNACAALVPAVDASMLAPGADAQLQPGATERDVEMEHGAREDCNHHDAVLHMGRANGFASMGGGDLITPQAAAGTVHSPCSADVHASLAGGGNVLLGPRPHVRQEPDANVNAVLELSSVMALAGTCALDQAEVSSLIDGSIWPCGTFIAPEESVNVSSLGADPEQPEPFFDEPLEADAGRQSNETTHGNSQPGLICDDANEIVTLHSQVVEAQKADASVATSPETSVPHTSDSSQQPQNCSGHVADEYPAVACLDSTIGSPAPRQTHVNAGGQHSATDSSSSAAHPTCDEMSMDVDTTSTSGEPAQNTWDGPKTIDDTVGTADPAFVTPVEASVECHAAAPYALTAGQIEGTPATDAATETLPPSRLDGVIPVQPVPTKEEEDAAATLSAVRHALRIRHLRSAAAPTTARRAGPEPAHAAKPLHLSGHASRPASHNGAASPGKRERQTTAAAPVKKARMALECAGGGAVSPLPMSAVGSPYTGFFTM